MRPKRVLVAESSYICRERTRYLISLCPALSVCGVTGNGLEALELLERERPDALVTELMLPELSGLGLISRCRAEGFRGQIVALAAAAGEEMRSAALAAGATMVLTIPVSALELVEDLRLLCWGIRGKCEALLDAQDGGMADMMGKYQAARAAEMLALEPGRSMKSIYLDLAREEGSGWTCVEKNIRLYVSRLYQMGAPLAGRGEGPASNRKFLHDLVQASRSP